MTVGTWRSIYQSCFHDGFINPITHSTQFIGTELKDHRACTYLIDIKYCKSTNEPVLLNMSSFIRKRVTRARDSARGKGKLSGWVLPKEASSFADEGTWSVHPVSSCLACVCWFNQDERRSWCGTSRKTNMDRLYNVWILVLRRDECTKLDGTCYDSSRRTDLVRYYNLSL